MGGQAEGTDTEAEPQFMQCSWTPARYPAMLRGVSVPMNVTMVIIIWFLTRLMLSEIGSGPAEIVRVLVLYVLSIFLLGPTVARMADGRPGPMALLTVGAIVSGTSRLSLTLWAGFLAIAVTVTGISKGLVLMQTPIFAMRSGSMAGRGRESAPCAWSRPVAPA